ncbi:MAG TPA: ATP-binding protein [Bacteroidetes bacterium]|nr:ATP-binding protein [Ignavibacteria bacterium]HCA43833.1 ATP-binding protein [Bacteroidota bacterium]HCN36580.1 ATP-binding protein [Bacteroidota bacterium]
MSLTVELNSFSYKKSGIPVDTSGNGGGFVFDCRFIFNPGRLDEYKDLTGKDSAVINFLDSQNTMNEFLQSVYALITPAIKNYLERNFSHLMINFGCTGGQHRSVYSAEMTKKFIEKNFPGVIVTVNHREFPHLNN